MTDDDIEILRPTDQVVCYHEAGHAVASVVLGRKVLFVEVDSGEDVHGIPHHGRTSNPPLNAKKGLKIKQLDIEAQIALAGPLAHAKAFDLDTSGIEDPGDRAKASELLRMILSVPQVQAEYGDESRLPDLLEECKDRTRQLLEDHWGAVERVAGELRTRRSLTGARVRQLVKQKRRPPAGP